MSVSAVCWHQRWGETLGMPDFKGVDKRNQSADSWVVIQFHQQQKAQNSTPACCFPPQHDGPDSVWTNTKLNYAVLCSARVQIRSHQSAAEKNHTLFSILISVTTKTVQPVEQSHRDAMNADTRVTSVSHGNSKCVTQTLNDFFSMLWCCVY